MLSLTIFRGLFDTDMTNTISVLDFCLCIVCSLVIGLLMALMYMYRTRYTQSFVATLALLPAIVCVVIMMVNGNVGTGVAVAGTFSLVRFRSVPGTAKEIGAIFFAMGAGVMCGMGYLGFALLFTVIVGLVNIAYMIFNFGAWKKKTLYKTIHITIPEDLDYTDVFQSIFQKYTSSYELVRVKTSNMGSLFRLTYDITLKNENVEKEMIDKIRCRNGNLEISISNQETVIGEL